MPKDLRKKFLLLSIFLIAEAIESYFDHLLSIPMDDKLVKWRVAVSVFGYTIRPLMLYVVLLIMTRNWKWKGKWKEIIFAIPSIITFVVAMMAFFTKKVFYYDATNTFQSGEMRYVIFAMLSIYFGMILVVNGLCCKKNVSEARLVFVIVALLFLDWISALFYDNIGIHEEVEAISVLIYFMYFLSLFHAEKIEEKEHEYIDKEHRLTKMMLDQSIETLAYTIDAKDQYTKGHSSRVAKYARMIATVYEKSEEECREVYLAALLHDIGKISISGRIISKPCELTEEEYEKIKQHPVRGAKILEKMKSIPYLQNGALYHHEHYDGTGFPFGLKGEEIPEIARIIAVADAYDAMTSFRSYQNMMDQKLVKQEIWKGMGTQFDPVFAKIMISLIDMDWNYELCEKPGEQDEIDFDDVETNIEWKTAPKEQLSEKKIIQETDNFHLATFVCAEDHWFEPSKGFEVSKTINQITFHNRTKADGIYVWCTPSVLIYSSDDGQLLGPNYDELGVFISSGYSWRAGSSVHEYSSFTRKEGFKEWDHWLSKNQAGMEYSVSVRLAGDEIILRISNELVEMESHLVMPEEYNRKIYCSITGERCEISDVRQIHKG